MSESKKRFSVSPIGLDLGSRTIKAAQLTGRGDGLRLRTSCFDRPAEAIEAEQSLPDAAELKATMSVLRQQGLKGHDVVIAVPQSVLLNAMLELPPLADTEAATQLARVEFARVHKTEPESCETGFWRLPKPEHSKPGLKLIGTGLRREDADLLLDTAEQAGVNIVAIDASALAVLRSAEFASPSQGHTVALLDIGWGSARIDLSSKNQIVYQRVLTDIGLGGLIANLREQFDLDSNEACHLLGLTARHHDNTSREVMAAATGVVDDFAERLAREVNRTMEYCQRLYPDVPTRGIQLLGGGAAIAGLTGKFSRFTEHPVELLAITAHSPKPAAIEQPVVACPGIALAAGLALYGEEAA